MAEGTSPPLSALRSLLSAREERPPPPPPLASRELEAAIRLDRPLLASLLARSDDISSPDFTRRALRTAAAAGHTACVEWLLGGGREQKEEFSRWEGRESGERAGGKVVGREGSEEREMRRRREQEGVCRRRGKEEREGELPLREPTPLLLAAARGHSGCVARMLAAHVSPDAGDSHMTPLSAACEGGHAVCVQWLIAAGAQLELGADKTPLSLACSLGHESCAEVRPY